MADSIPSQLGLIAGRGTYPLELAAGARRQGVGRIVAVAFCGETERAIARLADAVTWLKVGQLQAMLDALQAAGVTQAVMAGQLAPSNVFRLRPDRRALALLARLPVRNAHTLFGAVADDLRAAGVELLPAYRFMEGAMPAAGVLTRRGPTDREQADMALGRRAAAATSAMEIGQTVVVKDGVILAVEAFEGTDATLLRAGRLGGPGAVAVKLARRGHDLRFDIPVIGPRTIAVLRKIRAGALALEAGRAILLEREAVMRAADAAGLAVVAVGAEEDRAGIQGSNAKEPGTTQGNKQPG